MSDNYFFAKMIKSEEAFFLRGIRMKQAQLTNDDYLGHVNHLRHASRGILVIDGKVLLSYEAANNKYMIPAAVRTKARHMRNAANVRCSKRPA